MKFILLLLAVITVLGMWEMGRHRFMRRRIPLRIHVNGSRGKSSVTRLIAAGLQAGGVRTCAKTTGSAARFIHVDGSESPVVRNGSPNIREQLRVFRRAVSEKAEALVLECMAVRPDLQWVCEHRIVGSTHGVITNVRSDHLEVQGPRLDDVARSLAGTVPQGATLFTGEDAFAPYLERKARDRGSSFHATDPATVSDRELAPFAYVEFAENVSLALDVCESVGIARETALAGMQQVRPDVGALDRVRIDVPGKEVHFVNAFAANDPESTSRIWEHLGLSKSPEAAIVLYNNRSDRMRRARDLAPLFGDKITARTYVLVGESTAQLSDLFSRHVSRDSVVDLGGLESDEVWRRLVEICGDSATVVGVGNIGGAGMALLDLLKGKEVAS
ncbi:poly-gamma-glutamate synthase PgsB [bacterium]|nr:poly-gamma-glutamate synthase PgsB [bacterium]